MPINIVIIEDNHTIRNSLVEILEAETEFKLTGIYSNAENFVSEFETLAVNVVLMDINLPGMSGIECIKLLKPRRPEVQFMMCTVFEDNDKIFDSLCAGATGYMLKNTPPAKFFEAIRDIHSGSSPMSGLIARKVAGSFYSQPTKSTGAEVLTSREREILEYVSKGLRHKEISDKLFISHETVRTHIRNIYEKLHVKNRTEALNKVFPR